MVVHLLLTLVLGESMKVKKVTEALEFRKVEPGQMFRYDNEYWLCVCDVEATTHNEMWAVHIETGDMCAFEPHVRVYLTDGHIVTYVR